MDMSEGVVIAIISSGVLSTLVSQFAIWLRERSKKPTSVDNALQWLMRDRLQHIMTKALVNGETNLTEKQFVHKGYRYYHDLGGNGDMTDLVEEYDNLDVKY